MFVCHFLPFPGNFQKKNTVFGLLLCKNFQQLKMAGKWQKKIAFFGSWKTLFSRFRQNKKIASYYAKFPTTFVKQRLISDEVDFRLLLVGIQSISQNLQNCIKRGFNYFFSFSQFIFSLIRIFFGSARIQMFTPHIHIQHMKCT